MPARWVSVSEDCGKLAIFETTGQGLISVNVMSTVSGRLLLVLQGDYEDGTAGCAHQGGQPTDVEYTG